MTDPRSVLQSLGVAVAPEGHHHVSSGGDWLGVDCPSCSPGSGRFRMGLKFPTTATCHLCGPSRLWDTLQVLTGVGWRELKESFSGCDFRSARQTSKNAPSRRFVPPVGVCGFSGVFRDYARSRGLRIANCRLFGVGGIGVMGGKLAWSLYLPIRDGHETVSWTTRTLNPDNPRRYWSASADQEAMPHKTLLYGAELAGHAVCVVEGPLDAISLGPGGVATCGVVVTPAQVAKIARFPVRVVVADNEPKAIDRAERLAADLEVFPGKTHLAIPSGKDLLDSPVAERHKLIRRFLR